MPSKKIHVRVTKPNGTDPHDEYVTEEDIELLEMQGYTVERLGDN